MHFALNSPFSSNMVLQRGMPVPVCGAADPGARVTVSFRGQTQRATADASGQWKATLDPMTASAEPLELTATAEAPGGGTASLSCENVLTGEVWVCSGQSNMEWPVHLSANPDEEVVAADHPGIRFLLVARATAMEPAAQLAAGEHWEICSPQTAGDRPLPERMGLSAVAYYFGRELHRRLGVPVGLISSSVGGSPAEAWLSGRAFLAEERFRPILEDFQKRLPGWEQDTAAWKKELAEIDARVEDPGNRGFERGFAGRAEPADGGWQDMELPANWTKRGLDFNGALWFRRVVDIPAAWAGRNIRLRLGAIDKDDTTYFNGIQVGSLTMKDTPDAWKTPRVYDVPAELVRAGASVIAVRVFSGKHDAGMMGPAPRMLADCPEAPETPAVPLSGTWRYAVERNLGRTVFPPQPFGPGNGNTPAALFNAMIHPLLPFAVRGVIWYQGESNEDRAADYGALFTALVRDWRAWWANEKLAFHFVQLANFREPAKQPDEPSRWALVREAQAQALELPNTGMAVAIDIGEAEDIHPRNKQDVGRRLALGALHSVYEKTDVVPCGPMFREARREGTGARVFFDFAKGGLSARGERPLGFAVAGEDGVFHWAEARIDGETVVVSHPQGSPVRQLRYAWADNPACNLYNAAGLPASPFRTQL